jgi:acetolactate synthase-1/2/3 large subunit
VQTVLRVLAKLFQIPLTTTLMGKGSYSEDDYLSCGMLGMHGTAYANFVSECDLLIALGARFDRVTGKLDEFASEADAIHIDIDPAEALKKRYPKLAIVGDLRKILPKY